MLSEAAIKEFRELYFQENGREITDQEALDLGINLLTFINAVYRPVKKSWLAEFTDKEQKNNYDPHNHQNH